MNYCSDSKFYVLGNRRVDTLETVLEHLKNFLPKLHAELKKNKILVTGRNSFATVRFLSPPETADLKNNMHRLYQLPPEYCQAVELSGASPHNNDYLPVYYTAATALSQYPGADWHAENAYDYHQLLSMPQNFHKTHAAAEKIFKPRVEETLSLFSEENFHSHLDSFYFFNRVQKAFPKIQIFDTDDAFRQLYSLLNEENAYKFFIGRFLQNEFSRLSAEVTLPMFIDVLADSYSDFAVYVLSNFCEERESVAEDYKQFLNTFRNLVSTYRSADIAKHIQIKSSTEEKLRRHLKSDSQWQKQISAYCLFLCGEPEFLVTFLFSPTDSSAFLKEDLDYFILCTKDEPDFDELLDKHMEKAYEDFPFNLFPYDELRKLLIDACASRQMSLSLKKIEPLQIKQAAACWEKRYDDYLKSDFSKDNTVFELIALMKSKLG